jgi:hypothetical protein
MGLCIWPQHLVRPAIDSYHQLYLRVAAFSASGAVCPSLFPYHSHSWRIVVIALSCQGLNVGRIRHITRCQVTGSYTLFFSYKLITLLSCNWQDCTLPSVIDLGCCSCVVRLLRPYRSRIVTSHYCPFLGVGHAKVTNTSLTPPNSNARECSLVHSLFQGLWSGTVIG